MLDSPKNIQGINTLAYPAAAAATRKEKRFKTLITGLASLLEYFFYESFWLTHQEIVNIIQITAISVNFNLSNY